ncbi:Oxidoreductase BOA17 [Cladobotryum mycophilum]|uniref:Oxidoreductase BOA17 n=1 Tax=Cladobotryum mycophilum TaxID=491253 RepID=A0ABR0SPP4_9HYPO
MPRIWFVTGSSKGLGLALVEAILADGDTVAATARKPETLNHLVLKYGSKRILPLALDVDSYEEAVRTLKTAVDKFGRIDVIVNNAGYADVAAVEDMSIESFRQHIDTNLMGVVNVSKAAVPILRKQGSGRIIQVSSVGGRVSTAGLSAYQAAKWAVAGFSGVLDAELSPLGIKTTVVEPGGIKTDWASSADEGLVVSEPYKQTVGQFEELRKKYGEYRSEASQVAAAILNISKVGDPPLRLLVGPETVELAKKASVDLAESDEKWRPVTVYEA